MDYGEFGPALVQFKYRSTAGLIIVASTSDCRAIEHAVRRLQQCSHRHLSVGQTFEPVNYRITSAILTNLENAARSIAVARGPVKQPITTFDHRRIWPSATKIWKSKRMK